jgi:uncharacterized protein (TIGR00725 family)
MGGAHFVDNDEEIYAYQIGKMIALEGWVLLNGGRPSGVMEATAKGARENGGITVGVLPSDNANSVSQYIDIPIVTGMGLARNVINILSSDIVIALPGMAGTISEIALALNHGKKVILFRFEVGAWIDYYIDKKQVLVASQVEQLKQLLRKELY